MAYVHCDGLPWPEWAAAVIPTSELRDLVAERRHVLRHAQERRDRDVRLGRTGLPGEVPDAERRLRDAEEALRLKLECARAERVATPSLTREVAHA